MVLSSPFLCGNPLPARVTRVWGLGIPSLRADEGAHLVCQEAQLLQEILAEPQLVPHRVSLHLCPQGLGLLSHALLQGSGVCGRGAQATPHN